MADQQVDRVGMLVARAVAPRLLLLLRSAPVIEALPFCDRARDGVGFFPGLERNGLVRRIRAGSVGGLDRPFHAVFIRAPLVERVGAAVEVLAEHDGHPVLCRQGHVTVASFHPELAGDDRIHARFLEEV